MIAIINYGVGNLKSIRKAVEKFDKTILTSNPEIINEAEGIILPGVGAFKPAMDNLKKFKAIIKNAEVPVLGICLGMQLFADVSEEGGINEGLGIIEGRVVRFPKEVGKIPHMGWNEVEFSYSNSHSEDSLLIFRGIENRYFYFVHSYYYKTKEEYVIGWTEYGIRFPSAIMKDNFIGVQFHPEKSGKNGLKLIKNFVELCKSY